MRGRGKRHKREKEDKRKPRVTSGHVCHQAMKVERNKYRLYQSRRITIERYSFLDEVRSENVMVINSHVLPLDQEANQLLV